MIHKLKSAGLAALVGTFAITVQAQTNLVESLGFALTANYQGTNTTNGTTIKQNVKTESIKTADVIKLLGAATSNEFSAAAQLLKVTPIIEGNAGTALIIVRDVTSVLATKITTTTSTNRGIVTVHSVTNRVRVYTTNVVNVTGFFTTSTLAGLTSSATKSGVLDSESAPSVKTLALVSENGFPALTTTFSLQGFGVITYQKITLHDGLVVWGHDVTWTVNGTGLSATKGSLVIGADPSTYSLSDPMVVVGPGYLPVVD